MQNLIRLVVRVGLFVLVGLLAVSSSIDALAHPYPSPATPPEPTEPTPAQLPPSILPFIPNAGQTDATVRFQSYAYDGTLFFTPEEIVLSLPTPEQQRALRNTYLPDAPADTLAQVEEVLSAPADVVRLRFVAANPARQLTAGTRQPGVMNYLIGNDETQWVTDVPIYNGIVYEDLYTGIDVHYDGATGHLKSTYVVAPGVDPSQIRWAYEGVQQTRIDDAGNLLMRLDQPKDRPDTEQVLTEDAPIAWQEVAGQQVPVTVRYQLHDDSSIGFAVGRYNPALPLIIDPVLRYSTYLGGSDEEVGRGIAVDSAGNTYVAGYTLSSDFPRDDPYDDGLSGSQDGFVTKFDPQGNRVYSTYLGSSGIDAIVALAVNASGEAYVTGSTSDDDFPAPNSLYPFGGGLRDGFVTKLNAAGNDLVYSTLLGGELADYSLGIALDPSDAAVVVGYTFSDDFPTVSPLQAECVECPNFAEAFVAKINTTGSSLVYSTYLGDDGSDQAWAVAVGSDGTAYVTGRTTSAQFPRVNAYDSIYNGKNDVYVTAINAEGGDIIYSTFLGGDENETGLAITVDPTNTVYVAGSTLSADFPTEQPFQDELGSNPPFSDAFVTALAPGGGNLVYSTFLGGSEIDVASGIAVDATGHASVAGLTTSSDFPTVPIANPLQTNQTGTDGFVTTFHPNGRTVMQSTYLGGSGTENAYAIAIGRTIRPAPDPDQTNTVIDGVVHVMGQTWSFDFPTVNPAQPDRAGSGDAFMSTFTPYPHGTTSYYIGNTSQSAMYDLGCARGTQDATYPGADDSFVALFFGMPASSAEVGAGNFGTRLVNGNIVTTAQIAEVAQAFGQGYWECSPDTYELTLAVSTSNFTLSTGDDNVVTFEHGAAWATMINDINDWLVTNGPSTRIRAVGGNDIEIAWNTPEASRAWVDGYVSEGLWTMYNLGDAQACPPIGGPTCDNGWSVEDVWYVSSGAPLTRAIPQIYVTDGIQAQQWYELAVYSSEVQNEKMFLGGVLTQYQACHDRGDYADPGSVCRGGDLAPEQAWVSLWDLLNDDPRTEQELRWSTDVRWDYFVEEY